MVTFFKDLFCSAFQSNHPLAVFADPDLYLSRKHLKQQPTLRGMVDSLKSLPRLGWESITDNMPPIGTLMATNLQIWITPQNRPRPHPPNWRMDHVFRPQWTDPEQTLGYLEFIPSEERVQGYRSHMQLERNTNLGIFAAHPALRQALDVNGPLSLADDLATRINDVVIMRTKNITL
ncbi:hypothetical protein BGZ49_005392, partial [Haplosporangium sp. Z 27]